MTVATLTKITSIQDILNRLKNVKALQNGEHQACCPAHEDKQPSLNLKQEGDTILIKCQAGCPTESIVSALGLEMKDLFISNNTLKPIPVVSSKIVATYDYQDEKGNLLYQVLRYDPKSFRQRHKNGTGEWHWNMEGVRRVLYHLDELVKASGDIVYVVEGEKDADNLWANGKVATTSPGGANNWKPEYADSLKGKKVVVIPDKDAPGYSYAKDVIRSLEGKASDIKVIILPGDAKDVSEWLE
jgi:putative DNA primase/helicase